MKHYGSHGWNSSRSCINKIREILEDTRTKMKWLKCKYIDSGFKWGKNEVIKKKKDQINKVARNERNRLSDEEKKWRKKRR